MWANNCNLLEAAALPDRRGDTILRRARGNPLIVEEVIRMLIDRGAVAAAGFR